MVDIYELCKKLRPIIGQQADAYWRTYLAEDAEGKREILDALQLMSINLLGQNLENDEEHLSVPSQSKAYGEYPIGDVVYANKKLYPFGLRESEWLQHLSIFGRSGAGKTNTVFLLIQNLLNKKKPFLIFDWKRNYRDLLSKNPQNLLVYTVGGTTSPFAFNPLIPPKGVGPDIWLKKLIEIIAHSYFLGEGVMYLLQEAINAVYLQFGVYTDNVEKYPTFQDVLEWLENHPVKGRKSLWMDSTLRGIKSICFGPMGRVVNTNKQIDFGALLKQNVILELDRLTNSDKSMMIESMLLWIHHYRMGEKGRETFKHALIIEEAHHILAKQTGSSGGGEMITETVLREIRELGEAIVLVDQHPSMISPVAMGNTYTTICLNLKHRSDVNAMGSAMLMDSDEKDILGTLPIGAAVVKLQGRYIKPFQIKIPYQKLEKGVVTDQDLSRIMIEQQAADILELNNKNQPETKETEKILLTEKEESFLFDIVKWPYSGVVERYKRLHLSRRKGNFIKEKCLKNGLIKEISIPTRTGKVIIGQITEPGEQVLRDHGVDFNIAKSPESVEHAYWKHKAGQYYESLGYKVEIEKAINGYTDVIAERDTEKIAIEIETGKSDWQRNIHKNLKKDYLHVVMIATNEQIYKKINRTIIEEHLDAYVEVYQAQDIL
jgi:hypothetical protein